MKKFIIVLLSLILLTGCGTSRVDDKTVSEIPSMFVIVEDTNAWYVVYHKQTKVMYAVSAGYYNHGTFTLLVNADGAPMLYE